MVFHLQEGYLVEIYPPKFELLSIYSFYSCCISSTCTMRSPLIYCHWCLNKSGDFVLTRLRLLRFPFVSHLYQWCQAYVYLVFDVWARYYLRQSLTAFALVIWINLWIFLSLLQQTIQRFLFFPCIHLPFFTVSLKAVTISRNFENVPL